MMNTSISRRQFLKASGLAAAGACAAGLLTGCGGSSSGSASGAASSGSGSAAFAGGSGWSAISASNCDL